MTASKKAEAIYDKKVKTILRFLEEGMDREEVAETLGYSTYKSMDIYLRRRHFRWDNHQGTYVPKNDSRQAENPRLEKNTASNPTIAIKVIAFLDKGYNPRDVAKKLGYQSQRELSTFMLQQGYFWDGDLGNYIPESALDFDEMDNEEEEIDFSSPLEELEKIEPLSTKTKQKPSKNEGSEYARFLPLLIFLEENRDILEELIEGYSSTDKELPKYTFQGDSTNKNIHMSILLAQELEKFSKEHRVSQRNAVEAALVDLFRKYGWEIDDILED